MPKIKEFKDLSRRQQNRRLLAQRNNDEHNFCNTKCHPKEQNIMYYIIFYDNWCSTVPQPWINFENQTFVWPPKEINVVKAIIKNIPPKNNWSTHTYRRIMGPYKTYEIARKMENEAIYFNSLEEEQLKEPSQPAENSQKRILKRPLFYNELYDSSDNKHTTKKANRIPSFVYVPAYADEQCSNNKLDKHLPKSINDVASSSTDIPASSNVPKDGDENTNNVTWFPLTCKEEELNDLQSERTLQNDDSDITNVNDVNDVNDCEIQHDSHTCCEACRTIQETIIRKLDFIINLTGNKDATNIEDDTKLLPAFPLATIDYFFQFEKELQTDGEIRKQFRNKIAKIGGKSYAHKSRNIMKFIINDNIAKKLSWTGQKESIGIKNTVFASIIIDYITSTENCSLHEVQKVIQEWLRRAGDRLNYLFKKIDNSTLEKQCMEWQQRCDKNVEIQESQNSILHPLQSDQA